MQPVDTAQLGEVLLCALLESESLGTDPGSDHNIKAKSMAA